MPKKFIETEKVIAKAIKKGVIPKYYYRDGVRHEPNPYALARYATGYYGTTHHIGLIHHLRHTHHHLKH